MHSKIRTMFELQNTLNCNTNGVNWYEFMEIAEAIESIGSWKHWKDLNAETDYANIKIELTDVFHFLLSKQIEKFNGNITDAINDFELRYNTVKNNTPALPLLESLEAIAKTAINGDVPIREFINAVNVMDDFTMDDIYTLYLGKNCLNAFRQEHNYKNNIPGAEPYKKIINGKEDNVYMQQYLKKNSNVTYDELYSYLESVYSNEQ